MNHLRFSTGARTDGRTRGRSGGRTDARKDGHALGWTDGRFKLHMNMFVNIFCKESTFISIHIHILSILIWKYIIFIICYKKSVFISIHMFWYSKNSVIGHDGFCQIVVHVIRNIAIFYSERHSICRSVSRGAPRSQASCFVVVVTSKGICMVAGIRIVWVNESAGFVQLVCSLRR